MIEVTWERNLCAILTINKLFEENGYRIISVRRTCGCQEVTRINDSQWRVCFTEESEGKVKIIIYSYTTPEEKRVDARLTIKIPKKS